MSVLSLSVVTVESLDLVEEFHVAFQENIASTPSIPGLNAMVRAQLYHVAELVQVASRKARYYTSALVNDNQESQALHRARLMTEELAELLEAMAEGDMKAVLKESCDNRYVQDGTLVACGLAPVFPEGFRRVHESNMSKVNDDGVFEKDEQGKLMKGPNYKPCRLDDLIK